MADPRLFISYRRTDATLWASLIRSALARAKVQIYLDRLSNQPGQDYADLALAEAADCDVLLAIIGPDWAAPQDTGTRRLDDPEDLLRREISAGLTGRPIVVPVLVDDVGWADLAPLPAELSGLPNLHALQVRTTEPDRSVETLVQKLVDWLALDVALTDDTKVLHDPVGNVTINQGPNYGSQGPNYGTQTFTNGGS